MKLRYLAAVVVVSLAIWAALIWAGVLTYNAVTESEPITGTSQNNSYTVQWTWDDESRTWVADPICTEDGLWRWRVSHQEWTLDKTSEARATCAM